LIANQKRNFILQKCRETTRRRKQSMNMLAKLVIACSLLPATAAKAEAPSIALVDSATPTKELR